MPDLSAEQFHFAGTAKRDLFAVARARYQKEGEQAAKERRGEHGPLMTADPNQLAFPGMEQHAHPGAVFLSQGGYFTHHTKVMEMHAPHDPEERPRIEHEIVAHHPDAPNWGVRPYLGPEEHAVGQIAWWGREGKAPMTGDQPGAVRMIYTHPAMQGRGVGTAMGSVATQMTRSPPGMSHHRTHMGNEWAERVAARTGMDLPKRWD